MKLIFLPNFIQLDKTLGQDFTKGNIGLTIEHKYFQNKNQIRNGIGPQCEGKQKFTNTASFQVRL